MALTKGGNCEKFSVTVTGHYLFLLVEPMAQ
jgi:hypothetical protein